MTIDDIPNDLVVTIDDVRRRHCVSGARRWFESYGFDFRDFLKNGISARALWETGDALVLIVVEDVMERLNDG